MEFYHPPEKAWIPWESFGPSYDLIEILTQKIRSLAKTLREKEIPYSIIQQTEYNHNTEDWLSFGPLLDHPLFITIANSKGLDHFTAIVFHPYQMAYAVCKGKHPIQFMKGIYAFFFI